MQNRIKGKRSLVNLAHLSMKNIVQRIIEQAAVMFNLTDPLMHGIQLCGIVVQQFVPVCQPLPGFPQHNGTRVQAPEVHRVVISFEPSVEIIQSPLDTRHGFEKVGGIEFAVKKTFGPVQAERIGFDLIDHVWNRGILDFCFLENGIRYPVIQFYDGGICLQLAGDTVPDLCVYKRNHQAAYEK